jgi:hypothetical protein
MYRIMRYKYATNGPLGSDTHDYEYRHVAPTQNYNHDRSRASRHGKCVLCKDAILTWKRRLKNEECKETTVGLCHK